nr:hypothetical protein Iba_chr15bCG7700 [Ipomoea batatas]
MSQRLHPAIISGGFHRRQLLCLWLDLRLLASLPLTALSPPLRFSPSDLLRRPSASPLDAHFLLWSIVGGSIQIIVWRDVTVWR